MSSLATGLTEDTWSSRISQRLYFPSGSWSFFEKKEEGSRETCCVIASGTMIIRKIQMTLLDFLIPSRERKKIDDGKNRTLRSFV